MPSLMTVRVSVLWRMLLLFVVLLVVAAGAQAARTPKDEKVGIVPADQARARSVGLRRSDLPGSQWESESKKPSSGNDRCKGLFDPDLSGVTITGRATSPQFIWQESAHLHYLYSEQRVFATKAQLALEWRSGTSSAYRRCIQKGLKQGLSGLREVEASYPITKLVFPRVAPWQTAWQWRFKLSGNVMAGVDAAYLARGREVSLIILSWFGEMPNKALETRLVRVTGKRLAKAFP